PGAGGAGHFYLKLDRLADDCVRIAEDGGDVRARRDRMARTKKSQSRREDRARKNGSSKCRRLKHWAGAVPTSPYRHAVLPCVHQVAPAALRPSSLPRAVALHSSSSALLSPA